jgi:CubicO group peptidase (beta-lactamase class C family)
MVDATIIEGTCEAGYEPVREAFAANFAERGDVGAAVAMVVEGRTVVDLWGGVVDDGDEAQAWQADTLVNVWSTTKGVTAACFAMLVDRGLIDYDAPVARYWPEFAAGGKGEITVAMLLSHQGGLCGFREPATLDTFYDAEAAAVRLAAQEPLWTPGTQAGYHAISIGFLASALCRRVDGRSLRQFVAEELAGLDITIGLSASSAHRAATMLAPPSMGTTDLLTDFNASQIAALLNPPLDPLLPNASGWRSAEIPSANGFATARGLARLYGALADNGMLDGKHLAGGAAIGAATTEQFAGTDTVLGVPARWGCGFLCNTDGIYGPEARAFGHSGWGGAFAFGDPVRKFGFAYTMNRMGTDLVGDPRNVALVDAIYASAMVKPG